MLQLKDKLENQADLVQSEEATKQWFILPFLAALGYDTQSSDVQPEYTQDFGTKKGEKVDYALKVNNQPVAIVECKQLHLSLSEDNVQQLFRYFQTADIHIAILTNGNDYWFFTDSVKTNIMDRSPYFTFRLSTASEADIDKLDRYSKENILSISIPKIIQKEAFINETKQFMRGLKSNNIPQWLIRALWDHTKQGAVQADERLDESIGDIQIDKQVLAGLIYDEVQRTFGIPKVQTTAQRLSENDVIYDFDEPITQKALSRQELRQANKQNRQNIRLNHEYVYNDFSDGDWQFHKLDYAIVFGKKIPGAQFSRVLYLTVEYLLQCGYETRLMSQHSINNCLQYSNDGRHNKQMPGTNVYLSTSYSQMAIIKILEQLLKCVGVSDDNIILQFID